MAGSSRGHHAASTSGHGASRTSRRKNATQSPTRLSRPIASAQLSSVIGSPGPGSASSRVTYRSSQVPTWSSKPRRDSTSTAIGP